MIKLFSKSLISAISLGFIIFWGGAVGAVEVPDQSLGSTPSQTLILIVHSNGKAITVKKSFLKTMRFRKRSDERNYHRYSLLSQTNKVLYTGDFPDPLQRWVDDFSDPNSPKGGKETVAENEFMLKVPYLADAVRIRFERDNEQGEIVPMGVSPLPVPTK